ncbi:hypothetical protein CHY_2522 [Carboxydothermus hydrogenoformans Z-2901]|uniref:Uncharacterized protein n=1 Tax=Carboxydothermus hydrogenoformans (strain ATCC BAA-161 / DSM 6008 / Z-2901) TaxID=246194 RepID=Q3A969_CARHZ|nr:hypothetical protein CHY_2522 [Carboxydothermus hydrogenoformans Z-2901]
MVMKQANLKKERVFNRSFFKYQMQGVVKNG